MKNKSQSLFLSDRAVLQATACSQHATHDVTSVLMPVFHGVIAHSTSRASYLLAFYTELNLNYWSEGFNGASGVYLRTRQACASVKSVIAKKKEKMLTNRGEW